MGYESPKMSEQRAVAVPMRATSKPKVERSSMILYIRSNGNMLVSCLVKLTFQHLSTAVVSRLNEGQPGLRIFLYCLSSSFRTSTQQCSKYQLNHQNPDRY